MTCFTTKSFQPPSASKQLKDSMVKFAIADLHPFKSIEGEGFLSLRQMLVDFGAKFGQFYVYNTFSTHNIIARCILHLIDGQQIEQDVFFI